jgi:hypothetical protein
LTSKTRNGFTTYALRTGGIGHSPDKKSFQFFGRINDISLTLPIIDDLWRMTDGASLPAAL